MIEVNCETPRSRPVIIPSESLRSSQEAITNEAVVCAGTTRSTRRHEDYHCKIIGERCSLSRVFCG